MDFPEIIDQVFNGVVGYYTSRLMKRKDDPDYIDLDELEELFMGYDVLIAYVIEALIQRGRLGEAKTLEVKNPGVH